jgi:hypothetical protein
MDMIHIRRYEETVRLHLSVELPGDVLWKQLISTLSGSAEHWLCLAGAESIQRFGHGKTEEAGEAEFHSSVTVSRGDSPSMLWFETEGKFSQLQQLKEEVYRALVDTETAFKLCRQQQSGQPVAARFLTIADNLGAE